MWPSLFINDGLYSRKVYPPPWAEESFLGIGCHGDYSSVELRGAVVVWVSRKPNWFTLFLLWFAAEKSLCRIWRQPRDVSIQGSRNVVLVVWGCPHTPVEGASESLFRACKPHLRVSGRILALAPLGEMCHGTIFDSFWRWQKEFWGQWPYMLLLMWKPFYFLSWRPSSHALRLHVPRLTFQCSQLLGWWIIHSPSFAVLLTSTPWPLLGCLSISLSAASPMYAWGSFLFKDTKMKIYLEWKKTQFTKMSKIFLNQAV